MRRKPAQNLIEFVFVIGLLIVILLGILEFALFYRNVNVVEDIANEAAVTAARRFVIDSGANKMDSNDITNAKFNSAAAAAIDVVRKRRGSLGIPTLTFSYTDLGSAYGARPYALYQIDSTQTRTINGVATPLVTIFIDYRTPSTDGVMVQVVYQYRTLMAGAQLPVLGGAPIVIIPRDIPISSTRAKEYINY